MDSAAGGAARLLSALNDAAVEFRAFGYAQYLAHQAISWREFGRLGGGTFALGVVFDLKDDARTEVCLAATVGFRDDLFVVQADVMVDDRFLHELPDVDTGSLDECVAAVQTCTAWLCSHTSVLDDLGVPTKRR